MNEDEDIPLSEDPKEADFELMFEEIYNIILNNAKKDGPVLDTVANMLRAGEIAVSEDVVKAFIAGSVTGYANAVRGACKLLADGNCVFTMGEDLKFSFRPSYSFGDLKIPKSE
jgi:hypothetical protein